MQWKKSATGQSQAYLLMEGENTLVNISINHGSAILRATCQSFQRVFLIRKEGFWKNKTVIKNEYGHKLGQLYYPKWQENNGVVEFEDKKFQYSLKNNPLAAIEVYNEGEASPIVACGLDSKNGQTTVQLTRDGGFANTDLQYILFALTWYLFLPIAQENVVAYAM